MSQKIGPREQQLAGNTDEAEEDMVSLRTDRTGIANTIFVSTRGNARHAARIKIAVDPPDSLNPSCKSTSMAIHDYSTVGEYLPTPIVEQAKSFIERNRDILQRYWNYDIDTNQLFEGLAHPQGPRAWRARQAAEKREPPSRPAKTKTRARKRKGKRS